jgi:hypothetical protein
VDLCVDTSVSEEHIACVLSTSALKIQALSLCSSEMSILPTSPHGDTTQKTNIDTVSTTILTLNTLNFISRLLIGEISGFHDDDEYEDGCRLVRCAVLLGRY